MQKFCTVCGSNEIHEYSKTGLCKPCSMRGKKRPDMVGNTLRKGISPPWKGQKIGPQNISDDERERRRALARRIFEPFKFKKGHQAWNKGKSNTWMRGEKNPKWKGGATKVNAAIRRSSEMKKWRMRVLYRDGFICQKCGAQDSFHADHIKSFADHPELRFVLENGRTLCEDCHKKTPNYLRS